jgi:hypothetical protein
MIIVEPRTRCAEEQRQLLGRLQGYDAVETPEAAPAETVKETPAPKPLSLSEAETAHQRENKPATAKALVDAAIRDIQARDPQRSYADALSDAYGRQPELFEQVRRGS